MQEEELYLRFPLLNISVCSKLTACPSKTNLLRAISHIHCEAWEDSRHQSWEGENLAATLRTTHHSCRQQLRASAARLRQRYRRWRAALAASHTVRAERPGTPLRNPPLSTALDRSLTDNRQRVRAAAPREQP